MIDQPLLPLRVACAILRRGILERKQEQCIRLDSDRALEEHLFRVKPDIVRQGVYFTGNRVSQSVLARLRLEHCK